MNQLINKKNTYYIKKLMEIKNGYLNKNRIQKINNIT